MWLHTFFEKLIGETYFTLKVFHNFYLFFWSNKSYVSYGNAYKSTCVCRYCTFSKHLHSLSFIMQPEYQWCAMPHKLTNQLEAIQLAKSGISAAIYHYVVMTNALHELDVILSNIKLALF